jgi:thiamine kinase-like enzyme
MTTALNRIVANLPPFAGQALDDLQVQRLTGLTNRNYKLTVAGRHYVLRLPGAGSERYIDRQAEAHNAALAAGLGLCPEILYHDPRSGIQLRRFIDQSIPLESGGLADPAVLRGVVRLLQRLHRSKQPFRGHMQLFAKLDEYLQLAHGGDAALAGELGYLKQASLPLRSWLDRHRQPLVPCHIDPAPANFLMDKTMSAAEGCFYLLDWEYSAMCEPIWDLADLAAEAGFTAAQETTLLQLYYGAATPALHSHLILYRAMLDLLAAAWAGARIAAGADLQTYAAERITRVQTLLGAGELQRYLNR